MQIVKIYSLDLIFFFFSLNWIGMCWSSNIHENKIGEVETLDLFPLCSEDCSGVNGSKNDTEVAITAINTKLMSPNQYFEFLPLKN